MDGGDWYELACGPRGAGAVELSLDSWKKKYSAGWFEYDAELIGHFAAKFDQRVEELGGASSYAGGQAFLAAKAWEDRDKVEVGSEEAAGFVYHACRIMRESDRGAEGDFGPGYSYLAGGNLGGIAGHYLYSACKR